MWRNVRVAVLNATLQFFVIYRLDIDDMAFYGSNFLIFYYLFIYFFFLFHLLESLFLSQALLPSIDEVKIT